MTTLLDLKTEHPGGWADILAALENHAGIVPADNALAHLKKIQPDISGLMASAAQSTLAAYGLPIPGNPAWLQPAESWLQPRAFGESAQANASAERFTPAE